MYWLLGSKSHLSIRNKLLLYKAILKPIWTYGVQLWGLQFKHRNNSKVSKQIPQNHCQRINDSLHHDLNIPYVRDEIKKLSQRYADRMKEHSNILAINLMRDAKTSHRLKRKLKIYVSDRTINYNL